MTGYVQHMLDHDQTFEQFALTCARAFCALIHMRDERLIALAAAREEVARLEAMTAHEREVHGVNLRANNLVRVEKLAREQIEEITRCEAMLAQVEAWEPPTPEHEGMKTFMREQLRECIGGTREFYQQWEIDARALDALGYFERVLDRARREVSYHEEASAQERELVQARRQWIADLRRSLGVGGE